MSARPAPAHGCQGLLFSFSRSRAQIPILWWPALRSSCFMLTYQASWVCRDAAVTRPYSAVLLISLLFCSSSFSRVFSSSDYIVYVLHKLTKNYNHKGKQICTIQITYEPTSLTHHMVQFCTPFQIWSTSIHIFIQA